MPIKNSTTASGPNNPAVDVSADAYNADLVVTRADTSPMQPGDIIVGAATTGSPDAIAPTGDVLVSALGVFSLASTVSSTTKVTNLNADLLDDHHAADFALLAGASFSGDVTIEKNTPLLTIKTSTTETNPTLVLQRTTGAVALKLWADSGQGDCYIDSAWSGSAIHLRYATTKLFSAAVATNTSLTHLTMADGKNLIFNTTTGTKIGTGATQKIGFWNATPVVQPAAVADATTSLNVITQLNDLLAKLRTIGIIAT
jgi:hypothetical protein